MAEKVHNPSHQFVPYGQYKNIDALNGEFEQQSQEIVQGARKAQLWSISSSYAWWGSLGMITLFGTMVMKPLRTVLGFEAGSEQLTKEAAKKQLFSGKSGGYLAATAAMIGATVFTSNVARKLERENDIALNEFTADRTAKHISDKLDKTSSRREEHNDHWVRKESERFERDAQNEMRVG